jgi:vancomycin resistance protein YoaR
MPYPKIIKLGSIEDKIKNYEEELQNKPRDDNYESKKQVYLDFLQENSKEIIEKKLWHHISNEYIDMIPEIKKPYFEVGGKPAKITQKAKASKHLFKNQRVSIKNDWNIR